MAQHYEYFKTYFRDSRQGLIDHLSSMSNPSTWGTDIEVFAIATLMQCPIYVHANFGYGDNRWGQFSPLFTNASAVQCQFPFLAITYTGNHYNAARPIDHCFCRGSPPVLNPPKYNDVSDTQSSINSNETYTHAEEGGIKRQRNKRKHIPLDHTYARKNS